MVGECSILAELDYYIVDYVRFGENSIIDIRRCGTVMFTLDNNDHSQLTYVYHIMGWKISIINLVQVVVNGSPTSINSGVMSVRDSQPPLLSTPAYNIVKLCVCGGVGGARR